MCSASRPELAARAVHEDGHPDEPGAAAGGGARGRRRRRRQARALLAHQLLQEIKAGSTLYLRISLQSEIGPGTNRDQHYI